MKQFTKRTVREVMESIGYGIGVFSMIIIAKVNWLQNGSSNKTKKMYKIKLKRRFYETVFKSR